MSVAIVGIGARTASGLDALSVAMMNRANKSFPRETTLVDRAGEPIAMCRVLSLGDRVRGRDRLLALGAPPLAEATHAWIAIANAKTQRTRAIPVVVALSEAHSAREKEAFLTSLARTAEIEIDLARSHVITDDRAGGAKAIEDACARIERGEDEAIAVGGIDSYFDPARLEDLDLAARLHSPGCENGFIPGEGAGFALLTAKSRASSRPLAIISGASTEREPRPYGASEPCQAVAITLAMKRALASFGSEKIGWIVSDVVGERHRVNEFLLATGRWSQAFAKPIHEQPLMRAGDLGAATAAVLLAIACVGFATDSAPAPNALLMLHSDTALRGAIAIRKESA